MQVKRIEVGDLTYQSTVTYFTAFPRVLVISFWTLLPARPPPQVVPRMTCVTVRRPRVMDWLAPWALRTYFSLWSEMAGMVEPLM